jgi:hypothetical protein
MREPSAGKWHDRTRARASVFCRRSPSALDLYVTADAFFDLPPSTFFLEVRPLGEAPDPTAEAPDSTAEAPDPTTEAPEATSKAPETTPKAPETASEGA